MAMLCILRYIGTNLLFIWKYPTNCFLHGLLAFPIAGCFWVTPLFFSSRSLGPVPWLFFFLTGSLRFSFLLGSWVLSPGCFFFSLITIETPNKVGASWLENSIGCVVCVCLCSLAFQCLCWFQFNHANHVFPFEN